MRADEFLERCKTLWHVAPAGAWDRIKSAGFRTADQLIRSADIDDATRTRLLTCPRREPVVLRVDGVEVVLRDQGPLFSRRDLRSVLGDGMEVADWIHRLNQRVYFFANQSAKEKLLSKYVERDGAQDVIVVSPLRLLKSVGQRIELTSQNSGAIARRSGPQKHADTFQPLTRFPDRSPSEVTVVDGFDDLSVVVRAERHRAGRRPQILDR